MTSLAPADADDDQHADPSDTLAPSRSGLSSDPPNQNGVNETEESKSESRTVSGDAQSELPLEYQLYEVDLSNPDMDPLEYTFRRFVPIPKAYYWDTADETNHNHENLPFRIKIWHSTIFYLGKCLKKAEAAGEVVANVLGLNSGQFDYVTENMTEEEWERSRRNLEMRREEQRVCEEENKVKEDVGLSSKEVL